VCLCSTGAAASFSLRYKWFIGSLKAGFVTERSELGSCRAFSVQYPILAAASFSLRYIWLIGILSKVISVWRCV